MKYLKYLLLLILLQIAISITVRSVPQKLDNYEKRTELSTVTSEMEVHFIDVGQGDATLVICDGEAMLIDAGDNSRGTKIQYYLQEQGIEKLKYVIATHGDADHIGGLDVILYKFDCETIIMSELEKDTASSRDVMHEMVRGGYKNQLPAVGDVYDIGKGKFTILAPGQKFEDENNNSIAILLEHGENSFLLVGDAERESEEVILESGMDIMADVYKVGHHGSVTSTNKELLENIMPEYAVISCGKANNYGHPHKDVLEALKEKGIQVFRTDEQGTVIAYSDGMSLLWNCDATNVWEPGIIMGKEEETSEKETDAKGTTSDITYVCNKNSMKFHYPHCESVSKMSTRNRDDVSNSREELINQGYVPCKNCNP